MRWEEILEVGWPFAITGFIACVLTIITPDVLPYIKYLLGWIMIIGFLVAILAVMIVPVVLLVKSLFS